MLFTVTGTNQPRHEPPLYIEMIQLSSLHIARICNVACFTDIMNLIRLSKVPHPWNSVLAIRARLAAERGHVEDKRQKHKEDMYSKYIWIYQVTPIFHMLSYTGYRITHPTKHHTLPQLASLGSPPSISALPLLLSSLGLDRHQEAEIVYTLQKRQRNIKAGRQKQGVQTDR